MLKIYLEARHPVLKRTRFYHIALSQDLFACWLLTTIYGCLGTQGQTKTYAFKTVEEAIPKIKLILRKRATAPQRSGCQYHLIDLDQDPTLSGLDVSDLLKSCLSLEQKVYSPVKKKVFLPLFDD